MWKICKMTRLAVEKNKLHASASLRSLPTYPAILGISRQAFVVMNGGLTNKLS